MKQILEAVYDGLVFKPEKPVKIKPNTRVQMVITTRDNSDRTVADVAGHLFGKVNVDAPTDISVNKNHMDGFGE